MNRVSLLLALFAFLISGFQTPHELHADDSKGQEVTVSLKVPDGGWSVKIQRVYQVGEELWAVSNLKRSDGAAIQVISTVKDSVKVPVEKPAKIKHILLGKTWEWENEEPYAFLKTRKELQKMLKENKAKLIFNNKKKKESPKR